MKVLAINGSAREKGNTSILLQTVLDELKNLGFETEMVSFAHEVINPCKACFTCGGRNNCTFNNDIFNKVFDKMKEADGIILGSPVYSANISSTMQAFLERAAVVADMNPGLLTHKVAASVTAGRRGGALNTVDTMNHFFLNHEMFVVGSTYWNMGYGQLPGDVKEDQEALANMKNLGQNMAFLLNKINGDDKMDKQNMPKIALGAWAWGQGSVGGDQVFGNHYTIDDFKPVFNKAIQNNLNLWDTAYVYGMGASEKILGSLIKETNSKNIIISTKFTPQIANDSENAMEEMLEGSLERLNTDSIDIYRIHNPLDVEKWTPKLIPLAKKGKIKSIGVSNHNLSEIKRVNEILSAEGLKISAVQNHYSLLNRSSETSGIIDYCKENDITFYAYMVLEQGALSGKYNKDNPFPKGSQRAEVYNDSLEQLEPLLKELKNIADNYNTTEAVIATSWAISKGVLPLIGVTKVTQVEDAIKAQEITLTNEEVTKLEEIAEKVNVSTVREWEKEMK